MNQEEAEIIELPPVTKQKRKNQKKPAVQDPEADKNPLIQRDKLMQEPIEDQDVTDQPQNSTGKSFLPKMNEITKQKQNFQIFSDDKIEMNTAARPDLSSRTRIHPHPITVLANKDQTLKEPPVKTRLAVSPCRTDGGNANLSQLSKGEGSKKRQKAPKEIDQIRQDNDIEKISNFKNGKEYLESIRFSIPTGDFFSVLDSCHFNHFEKFCPVLVQDKNMNSYQLQIWKKGGFRVFERSINVDPKQVKPFANWNVFDDVVLFQESDLKSIFYVKLFQEQNSQLYRFDLQITEKELYGVKENQKVTNTPNSAKMPSHHKLKPERMVGYTKSFIFLIIGRVIHYFNAEELIKDVKYEPYKEHVVEVAKDKIFFTEIQEEYLPLQLMATDEKQMCLVMSCKTTSHAQFLGIAQVNEKKIKFHKMGIPQHRGERDIVDERSQNVGSPIEQFISVISKDQTGKQFQAGISRLQNGQVNFYSDFKYLNESRNDFIPAEESQKNSYKKEFKKIIEIGTDNRTFHFRCEEQQEGKDGEYFTIPITFGKRLGLNCSKLKTLPTQDAIKRKFHYLLDRRITQHFKQFDSYMEYQTFFLIAYRDRVAVFDLCEDAQYMIKGCIQFKEEILEMSIVKQYDEKKDQFDEVVIVTTYDNKISKLKKHDIEAIMQMDDKQKFSDGRLPCFPYQQDEKQDGNMFEDKDTNYQQIIKVMNDNYFMQTVFYLTADSKFTNAKQLPKTYIQSPLGSAEQTCSKQNTFLNHQKDDLKEYAAYSLYAVNPNKLSVVKLKFKKNDLITKDSQICFYSDIRAKQDDDEELKKVSNKSVFNEKTVNVMIQNNNEKFQIFDLKMSKTAEIIELVEVTDDWQNLDKLDTGDLVGVVACTAPEYGKMKNSLVRVTNKGIFVYSAEYQLKHCLTNTNIIQCLAIDGTYLYCLCGEQDEKLQIQERDKKQRLAKGIFPQNVNSGLYVYDLTRFVKEKIIELYQLSKAIGGVNCVFDYSFNLARVSFVQNFSYIQMQPFSHRNCIEFIGMEQKENYVIWREKNGFFSAVSKTGEIHTWSMASGKHLYVVSDPGENGKNIVEGFQVLSTSEEDNTYRRNFYDCHHSSISLLYQQPTNFLTITQKIKNDQKQYLMKEDILQEQRHKRTMFYNPPGAAKTIVDQEIQLGQFEFKVVEFKMHQDFVDQNFTDPCEQETLKCLFTFQFEMPILPLQAEKNQGQQSNEKRIFDPRIKLFLSKNTKLLMVVVDNNTYHIYKRDEPKSDGDKITWTIEPEKSNLKYPGMLAGKMQANFLFSPNFKYFINVDYEKEAFQINESNGKFYCQIPNDLINIFEDSCMKNHQNVTLKASRLNFKSDSKIEFITPDGLWILMKIISKNNDKPKLSVVSSLRLKNWDTQEINHIHSILQPKEIEVSDVFIRLKRMIQKTEIIFETVMYDDRTKSLKLNEKQGKNRSKSCQRFMQSLQYRIEHDHVSERSENFWQTEFSFTILDWLILEEVMRNPQVSLSDVDTNQRIQLAIDIFPKRKTFLHFLTEYSLQIREKGEEDDNYLNVSETMTSLFNICKQGYIDFKVDFKDRKACPVQITILEDIHGCTPMDTALGIKEKHKQSHMFIKSDEEKPEVCCGLQQDENINPTIAGILFACVSQYDYLHSGTLLADAIVKAIRVMVPGIGDYLQNRMCKADHLPSANQRPILEKLRNNFLSTDDRDTLLKTQYGSKSMKIIDRTSEISQEMFCNTGPIRRMDMRYLDIPHIHEMNKIGIDFMSALNQTSEVDMFLNTAIQAIINYHWDSPQIKSYLFCCQIIPYLVQLGFFGYWSIHVIKKEDYSIMDTYQGFSRHYEVEWVLVAFSIWFLLIQLRQLFGKGFNYLSNFWVYIEMTPMVLIIYQVVYTKNNLTYFTEVQFHWIQAFTAMFMWLKSFYYLRCFEATGYFIRSLSEIIKAMIVFLGVLLLIVLGFSDSFYSLNVALNLQPDDYTTFYDPQTKYPGALFVVYQMLYGQIPSAFYDPVSSIFIMLFTILGIVIMFNLLIALVSDSFAIVKNDQVQYSFKEKVSMIHDAYSVINFKFLTTIQKHQKNTFLFVVQEDADNKIAVPDDVNDDVDETLKDTVGIVQEDVALIKSTLLEMKETFADMMEKIQMKKETVTEARTATVSNSPFRSS